MSCAPQGISWREGVLGGFLALWILGMTLFGCGRIAFAYLLSR